MPKKVLVTGGAGFIGSHIVEGLLSRGYHVGVLDDFSTGEKTNLPHREGLKVLQGDVCNIALVREVVKEYDWVVHQAARVSVKRSVEDPLRTNNVNLGGTLNLLIASKDLGVERFVFASSSSVYGETPTLPKVETMPPSPISPYAVSKLSAENYCVAFARVYGLPTVALRYFNVYGPRQKPGPYSGVIPEFINSYLEGRSPTIFGDGLQSRDFTFVKDVVDANILCLEEPVEAGAVFNVGSHTQTTVNQLAEIIAKLTGRYDLEPRHAEPREGDVRHSFADISKISSALGYKPNRTLEKGLSEVVDWFKSKNGEKKS